MDIDSRRLVHLHAERVTDVSSTNFPGHYLNEDNSWNLQEFNKNLQVKVQRISNRSMEFDLVGVDASIANAFRRIMIAEVPTVCIEQVYVWNNTGVIVDEVLSHRLGLIPLNVDPELLSMKEDEKEPPTDRNTLVFELQLTCQRNPQAPRGSMDPAQLYINHELKSGHLQWKPAGEQDKVFAHKPPAPTNPNILLAKLRPGQEVSMELHAVKGVGKDHAKFSPVATASYRLLPHIAIVKLIPPELAEKFQSCFSPGVIEIDPKTKAISIDDRNLRKDSVSREVLRHPEFADSVKLGRVRDFFLFNVESEGPYSPERIFLESIRIMRTKISRIRETAVTLQPEEKDPDGDILME